MRIPAIKDIALVGIQFLLFALYVLPINSIGIQVHWFLRAASFLTALIGMILVLFSMLQLKRNLSPFPTPISDGYLIKEGLYKYIRHPIYSGIILTSFGFGIFRESLWKLGVSTLLTLLFLYKSKYEEKQLSGHFPDYAAYKKSTGRFFPFA